jgi:FkbM family methyltransferase
LIWICWLIASYLYAHLYRFLHDHFRINLPGLGWLMRHIKRDLVLQVNGVKLYMYSPIAGSNGMQLINRWNEPETHRFLDSQLEGIEKPVTFIDVGANIGEMVMDMARNQRIKLVYAFEPVEDCVRSMNASVAINGFVNVRIRHMAVSNQIGKARFTYSATNPSCSGIGGSGNVVIEVPTTTLDTEFPQGVENPILLLDVEGAEKDVLVGGANLIKQERPLIIFEYNQVSRSHFNLDQICEVLGSEYEIFRLRQRDGLLDDNLKDTWNCVAVHRQTPHYIRCKSVMGGGATK